MTRDLVQRFADQMGRLLGPNFPSDIALAVSGGGDSMAMLTLAHGWARVYGVGLHVVTVDHGLRSASRQEAEMVAKECAVLGHPHTTLKWQWDNQGNLQDAARRARLSLIGAWRGQIAHVLFAHTRDDQAETMLMRLLRGSGVDGLSAMAETRDMDGWQVIRPLLSETRADLRHYADVLRVPYVDDPSNEDETFDRVRLRGTIKALGMDTRALANTAARMGRARTALEARAVDVARACVTEDRWEWMPTGDLLIDRDRFAEVEPDTQLRVLAGALQWVTTADYRPRAAPLEDLLDRALSGGGGTLHGARTTIRGAHIRVSREFDAIEGTEVALGSEAVIWDTRWQVFSTDVPSGRRVRALGPDGWQQATDKPDHPPPHDAAICLPALFEGDRLVAWHPAHGSPGFQVKFKPPRGHFTAFLVSR
ncbi:tRNA lysidine(34) synthetase TilS [Jannaschia sp. CCS1]|uniref:tRNA lysidine(34) synthetase TilS n=1 Tax=Jannaschia sp. (strain CCS1) TaxID=290400 RepID=UPI000053C3DB|nr:tRNA lysidine(34) synthetase TilS [Jannaschia sp. CCS1]ABD53895.1 tRNA(Ile)-lysidine synthetase-like protein [Jannaschia sp. CCS1]